MILFYITHHYYSFIVLSLYHFRLTCSEPLGHLLYNYTQGKNTETVNKCLPLAQAVYTKVGAHIQSAVCMCKQGRVRAMMEYAHNVKFSKGKIYSPRFTGSEKDHILCVSFITNISQSLSTPGQEFYDP